VDLPRSKTRTSPPLRGKTRPSASADKGRAERALQGIAQVAKEREAWRKKNAVSSKDAFDVKLVETLKAQAARKGISY
jgi:hypothetical protein